MARTRSPRVPPAQTSFADLAAGPYTAPCVPGVREAVGAWREAGYEGATRTTRELLAHWFETDHRTLIGRPFQYHYFQREAIEALIYLWEVERIRSRTALLERYVPSEREVRLPLYDPFARLAVKMATGSGKTKVMSLALAWQYLNAAREEDPEYAKTFLLIAPNLIVLDRLRTDFGAGRVFQTDPVVPKHLRIFWDLDCVTAGEGERAASDGALFLTNIQQMYEPREKQDDEPRAMLDVLGPDPSKGAPANAVASFAERIADRDGSLLVINDEAHHTHEEDSEWNKVIRGLHETRPLAAQLDFSATPRYTKGGLFSWTVYDYPLKQAIQDNIVKRPMKGVANIREVSSDVASTQYEGFLVAGVNRWREYRDQLAPLGKKPILFVMMNDTADADDVGHWLRTKYPGEFGGDGTLVIHTDRTGEVSKKDLDRARTLARDVDNPDQPVNAIVSVLMLREGWDVQNVTVVVGLRPYTAKANILPGQTIGRGLRLMFRGSGDNYVERVDVIGNKRFIEFVEDLEKIEDVKLDTFDPEKDTVRILTVAPQDDKAAYDIGLPQLSPTLLRKRTLAEEIQAIDARAFQTSPLPIKPGDAAEQTFRYEGFDIITLDKMIEREYEIPESQTAGEVIGYYAKLIAADIKLPSQFAHLAPKVREFFRHRAFGQEVDLEDKTVLRAMSRNAAQYVVRSAFGKALKAEMIEEAQPELLTVERKLSACQPFPFSRQTYYAAKKCIFNVAPTENEFERTFAHFLDDSPDVTAFAKLPDQFGFAVEYIDKAANMRYYYPDFVAVADTGEHWLIETKGYVGEEVAFKDRAATLWCENATRLTDTAWRYLRVDQGEYNKLQPGDLADLMALGHPPG